MGSIRKTNYAAHRGIVADAAAALREQSFVFHGPEDAKYVGDAVSVIPGFSFADHSLYSELINAPAVSEPARRAASQRLDALPTEAVRHHMRREIHVRTMQVDLVAEKVRELCILANHELRADHIAALQRGLASERSEIGCQVLRRLLESAEVSAREQMAFCQDTGYAVVFLHVGQDVHFTGGDLVAAINRGVAEAYRDGYLRASLVRNPIDRRNTGDNTPAMIYYHPVAGEGITLTLLIKGAATT